MTMDDLRNLLSSSWVIGPAVFIIWCIVMFVAKGFLYRKLSKLTGRTTTHYDNILVSALNWPLNIIILFLGFSIIWKIIPIGESMESLLHVLTKVAVVLSATLFVDRFIVGMLKEHDNRFPAVKLSQGVLQGLIRTVVFILGGFILLDNVGVSISPLIASLGIVTLAVGLALQSTLANFFAGLFIIMDKSVKVGDFIQLESGESGYVDDVGWRASRIRLRTNNHVIIPNSKLVESIVTNFHAPRPELYCKLAVGVHYDSDLDHVEKVSLEVAQDVIDNDPGTIKGQGAFFRFTDFGESSINFNLRIQCRDYDAQLRVTHHLIKSLHKRFNDEGITIPYPMRTLDIQPKHEKLLEKLADDGKA